MVSDVTPGTGAMVKRLVFVQAVGVIDGDRRVVDRVHREGHGGDVAVGLTVIRLVGEAVAAVVIGARRVGERTIGVQRQRAVGRAADQDGREAVAVHVAVIAQHARALTACGVSSAVV